MTDTPNNAERVKAPALAFSVPESAQIANISRSELYVAMKRGDLKAKKHGRRTVILASDLASYLANLPDYQAAA